MPKTLPNVKEEILQTTREMLLEERYDDINIRDIAKRCGIATGTFYNYFRSKQEILSSLIASDWEKIHRSLCECMQSNKPPLDQLEDMFVGLKKMMHSVHKIWREGYPADMESAAMNRLQKIKLDLRIEFSECVLHVLHGHTQTEKEAFTADFIARIFFSYAYDENQDFGDLRYILEKFID